MSHANPPLPTETAPAAAAPTANTERAIDQGELEIACVDLISHLESLVSIAKDSGREEHMENAAETAKKILTKLLQFSDRFFVGDESQQTREEISKALHESATYQEVLNSRSWGSAIKRAFLGAEDNQEIKSTYETLGLALIRACATVLYHAIVLVGFDSPLGKQIDQSTVVFFRELKESW
jgi:hypothetical protein